MPAKRYGCTASPLHTVLPTLAACLMPGNSSNSSQSSRQHSRPPRQVLSCDLHRQWRQLHSRQLCQGDRLMPMHTQRTSPHIRRCHSSPSSLTHVSASAANSGSSVSLIRQQAPLMQQAPAVQPAVHLAQTLPHGHPVVQVHGLRRSSQSNTSSSQQAGTPSRMVAQLLASQHNLLQSQMPTYNRAKWTLTQHRTKL